MSAVSSSAVTPLARARDALATSDFDGARDALIEAWRLRRDSAVADLVDAVAGRAPDAVTATLAEVITPRVASTQANLRGVAGLDDPRVSRFAIDALARLPFTTPSAEVLLHALLTIIEHREDRRLLAQLDAIDAAVQTRIGRLAIRQGLTARLREVAEHLPELTLPTAEEAALAVELAHRIEPLRRVERSADALLAEVYAHPEDDGPRVVLSDLLLERGDPRGEFIALQLARGDDDPPSDREQALLKQHGKAWLGSLAPVLTWGRGYANTQFRRGFVAVADVMLSVGKKLEPLRHDPAWATIEHLEGWFDPELLATAPLRALREMPNPVGPVELARFARRAEPLARVRQVWVNDPVGIDPALLRAAFPGLETVARHWYLGDFELSEYARLGVPRVAITNHWWRGPPKEAVRALDERVRSFLGTEALVESLALARPNDPTGFVELVRGPDGRFILVDAADAP